MRPRGNDLSLGTIIGTDLELPLFRGERDKHLYIAGATGTGKSKFIERLIRQDIVHWRDSHSGLLMLDPHGSLYDSIIRWLATYQPKRPIIPIDLRRHDWVVSYNLLRRRTVASPAVVVDAIVTAMAHVWGQAGTDLTPLFARWASNVLQALYENRQTLVEAIAFLDSPEVRAAMTADLKDRLTGRDWRLAETLSPKDFEQMLSSTINRFQRFLRNDAMRLIFGQSEVSLDLGQALEEGSIILVCLATEGARVSQENADLFATLLLTDLWTAAQERGKREAIKPFYLYLDEFQKFVTPSIAESLDQARGFGLHITVAHQFPQQLLDRGDDGRRLFHSIMENASSKVVFRLSDQENLRPLAQWLSMGVMDIDEVKHTLYSTKVVGYDEEYRTSYSKGTGRGSGGGRSRGRSTGQSNGESMLKRDGDDEEAGTQSSGRQDSESESDSESWSESHSQSETESSVLIPRMGQEVSSVQFRSLEEQTFRAMAELFGQGPRQCVVRTVSMRRPVRLMTPEVIDGIATPKRVRHYLDGLYARLPYALTLAEAGRRLAARETRLLESFVAGASDDREPSELGRRINRL